MRFHELSLLTFSISFLPRRLSVINPNVAKVEGLQSQGAKDKAVVNLLRTLGNAGFGVIRLSIRVNNMGSNRSHPLNSPRVRNQKGEHFYDFCLKIE